MIQRLSNSISLYLCNELNYDYGKQEVISYGLQVVLGTSSKIITIFVLSYLLGTFHSTFIVTLSFVFFRRIIGGSHCSTFNHCYFLSIFLMLSLGAVGKILSSYLSSTLLLTISIYFISMFITFRWVPMGTEKKTIKNPKTRHIIKIKTAVLMTIWSISLIYIERKYLININFTSLLGISAAFFLATPLGGKLTSMRIITEGRN